MFEIRTIEKEKIYSIRHSVLRPYQTVEDCKYDTDDDADTFHVGAFYSGKLISVASFCVEKLPDFSNEKQYRLRAMATLEDFRNLGAGRAVVEFAENAIREMGSNFLWCKGRISVQEYYNKLGFIAHGDVFDYPPIGLHVIMYKELDSYKKRRNDSE